MSEYSEDALVEQSAIDVFKKDLHYEHLDCYEEKFPETLGRETRSEVVLVNRLSKAIDKLNPGLLDEAKKEVISQLLQDMSRFSLVGANQEVYKLLKDGVKINTKNKRGESEYRTVQIIDFKEPENNDFFLASQFWVTGEIYTRRPDLVCFINGLPLVVIEFKARGVDLKRAFEDNITDYKDAIPQLFWYNAFIIISNGRDSRIGSLTSGYEHFSEWKRVSTEKEIGIVSLDQILHGTCEKNRLIDLLENFTLFTTIEGNQVKIIAKNHQFLGVNNAIESFKERQKNKGRLGVFWHTQGSGKSYSMIFFSQKVLRKFEGNFTFVVVTDRLELDKQIYENFQLAGAVKEEKVQAESGEHLKMLLTEDHRLVFTLVHKFNTKKGEKYPKLSDRDDIIIMTDEAHRTQYDVLALNMRNALPNAAFLAFTGTPLMADGEERTRDVFGEYVSIYNFRASVEDQATVPLYYENKTPELHIINPNLNDDIYEIIEGAELSDEEEEKLARVLATDYHIITRDERLDAIAKDIVDHFVNRGYSGKAMVVSIDKFTTVKMYDKVQYYWQKYINTLEEKVLRAKPEETQAMKEKVAELKKVDMAVVISQEQNEVRKFKEVGLDIAKHRKRMVKEDLAAKFKDPDNNLEIVFVCNMWMTGFDVPCLSTIYLDKPMRNHTLMQAIARANRVFKDKQAGFIVDYSNIFRSLKKALAIYAAPSAAGQIDLPIESKDKLVDALRRYIIELDGFMEEQGIESRIIIKSKGLEKNDLLNKALSALVINDNIKKEYLQKAGTAIKVYSAILPHKNASEFSAEITLYQDLIKEIRSLDPEVDITPVLRDIQTVLDKSISSRGYSTQSPPRTIDLSQIDFEALRKQFERKKNNADIERLKNILTFKLKEMVRLNSLRIDYQEKFQKLIDEYNAGSINQETFFEELLKFSRGLNEEERRALAEGLTEEELALFDKLKKPDLSEKDKIQIKNVSKELLHKLEPSKLVLDWRKKQQTRAMVRLEIEKELDTGLPKAYTEKDYQQKCQVAFQHFYDNYFGDGSSIFNQPTGPR